MWFRRRPSNSHYSVFSKLSNLQSLLNFKIKELSKENKAINEQPEQADKEVWCSDPNLLVKFIHLC